MRRVVLVASVLSVLVSLSASAQDGWHAAGTFPCAGGIRSARAGAVVACHGELAGARFVGGPTDALGRAGDGWVAAIDEGDGTGLAVLRLAPDGLTWARGAHVATGMIVGTAVAPDATKVATVEVGGRGAHTEVKLVERALPSLATLRQVRLVTTGDAAYADVRYVRGGIAVATADRVVVVPPRGPARTVLEARHGVVGLAAAGGRAVSVAPLPGDALELRVADVRTGGVEASFEITGGAPSDVVISDDGLRIALLDDDGIRVVSRPSNAAITLARRDDAVGALALLGDAILAWRGPTADDAASLTRWERGATRAPGSAAVPRIDPRPLSGFAVQAHGAARAPLRVLDGATRPLVWTKLLSASTADEPSATLSIEVQPTSLLPDSGDASAWARAVAAMLGPVYVESVHVVSDHVLEIEGWDDGCDPPAAWVRIERRGGWLLRTELSVYGGDDASRARAEAWREALRHAVAPGG